jgi:hypothetical protein
MRETVLKYLCSVLCNLTLHLEGSMVRQRVSASMSDPQFQIWFQHLLLRVWLTLEESCSQMDVVAHTCNPSTRETELGGCKFQDQPGLPVSKMKKQYRSKSRVNIIVSIFWTTVVGLHLHSVDWSTRNLSTYYRRKEHFFTPIKADSQEKNIIYWSFTWCESLQKWNPKETWAPGVVGSCL